MEIEQVAELARTVAALTQRHQDFFNGLVADERAKSAQAETIARLWAMSDVAVVNAAATVHGNGINPEALKALAILREAGFVREVQVPAFLEGIVYNKGDRVMVRGRIYECLSDCVTGFYRCEGDPTVEVPRLTTPNWQAVGA
ncbi:hypothetical protein VQ03_29280 [Methylobacterium tarhaniae]|uniref:Uncharacterized protein n=1 Tax=Methylobacterium tarhaniae TaxID=1187852 RepID=A0A0J6S2X0_9HYPH|nr:hypothetical protein [Methylobacterium tarhaniae]KMO29515.1 hypothetical protein VQ03_29280 [Methylobacterium tarhaniae]